MPPRDLLIEKEDDHLGLQDLDDGLDVGPALLDRVRSLVSSPALSSAGMVVPIATSPRFCQKTRGLALAAAGDASTSALSCSTSTRWCGMGSRFS